MRTAVWDLGSSSFHLVVFEVDTDRGDPAAGGSWFGSPALLPVVHRRTRLDLGASVGATGAVSRERMTAAVAAVRRLRAGLVGIGPLDAQVALATAAIRDATNGAVLVDRLERSLGIPLHVLDGEEEARRCFLGQCAGVWTGSGRVLGLDLGGGSLELAAGRPGRPRQAVSAPIGAVRLHAELQVRDPVTSEVLAAAAERTAAVLAGVAAPFAVGGHWPRAILSGGTARALARILTASASRSGAGNVTQVEMPVAQLAEAAERFVGTTEAERRRLPGMPARRAATVPIGAAILCAAASCLGVERYVVSEWGLREGAALDAAARAEARAAMSRAAGLTASRGSG